MRHLMTPDPDRSPPTFRTVLWIYALILFVVVVIGIAAKHYGG